MRKIPVGETIRFAYQFTLGQIGTIIGLIWIPAVLTAVGSYFFGQMYARHMADAFASGASAGGGTELLLLFCYQFVALLFAAIMLTAVTQLALGLRSGPAVAHFHVGPTEFRVVGGMLALALLLFIFIIGYALATVALVSLAALVGAAAGKIVVTVISGLVSLAGIAAVIYAMVRLSFVMVPAITVEGGFGIARSWELTQGNFWRIFAIGLSTVLPLLLVVIAVQVIVLGPGYFVPDLAAMKDPALQAKHMAAQMESMAEHLPVLAAFGFVIAPLLYGLGTAPSAFAYRQLTSRAPQSLLDSGPSA